jgi:hypothetical protein
LPFSYFQQRQNARKTFGLNETFAEALVAQYSWAALQKLGL